MIVESYWNANIRIFELIRMKELAEKQQRAANEAERKSPEPRTPPSSPVQDHPQPLTSQPAFPAEPPARPETPLERTLLELLNDKDLGATGFVTASELAAVLASLPDGNAVNKCSSCTYYMHINMH